MQSPPSVIAHLDLPVTPVHDSATNTEGLTTPTTAAARAPSPRATDEMDPMYLPPLDTSPAGVARTETGVSQVQLPLTRTGSMELVATPKTPAGHDDLNSVHNMPMLINRAQTRITHLSSHHSRAGSSGGDEEIDPDADDDALWSTMDGTASATAATKAIVKKPWVALEDDPFRLKWNIIALICIVVYSVIVPMQVAFAGSAQVIGHTYGASLFWTAQWICWCMDIFFWCDLYFRMRRFGSKRTDPPTDHPRAITRLYRTRPLALVRAAGDIFSCFPVEVIVILVASGNHQRLVHMMIISCSYVFVVSCNFV